MTAPRSRTFSPPQALPVHPAEAAFAAHERAFEALAGRASRFEHNFLLAGRRVSLRVAGECLGAQLGAAFAHLPGAVDPWQPPDLIIQAIDRSLYPAPQLEVRVSGPHALGQAAWRQTLLLSPDGRFVCNGHIDSGSVWCLDRKRSLIVGAANGPAALTLFELGKPFQPLLTLWASQTGLHWVHAGLVAQGGCGVMLAGPGGAGKSTATLCCLAGGFSYLGDDYLLLEQAAEAGFLGHSIYGSAALAPDHLLRFPDLTARAIPARYPRDDKSLLMLPQVFPERLAASVAIRFVLLPRVRAQRQTKLYPAGKGEALRHAAPSSLFVWPRLGREGFQVLAKLLERVECCWLDLGTDLETIVPAIAGLVR